MDSIEIHASMGDVKIERASAANPEEVEFVLAENVYQVIVQHGLLLVMPQDSYTATGQAGGTGISCSTSLLMGIGT